MAAKIKTLFDKLGNKLYPKTKTSAVYDDNNVTLNVSLNNYAHFIDEQSVTPISNPNLYRSDIDTSALSTSDVKVPSSNLVKTNIDSINNQLEYGVKFRDPTSITTESNPIIRKGDLTQTITTSQDVPPSSNAVKEALTNFTEGTISFNTAGTNLGSSVFKRANVVTLTIGWSGGINASGDIAIATIPAGYRPKYAAYAPVITTLTNKGQSVVMAVDNNGILAIHNYLAEVFADNFYAAFTYDAYN